MAAKGTLAALDDVALVRVVHYDDNAAVLSAAADHRRAPESERLASLLAAAREEGRQAGRAECVQELRERAASFRKSGLFVDSMVIEADAREIALEGEEQPWERVEVHTGPLGSEAADGAYRLVLPAGWDVRPLRRNDTRKDASASNPFPPLEYVTLEFHLMRKPEKDEGEQHG